MRKILLTIAIIVLSARVYGASSFVQLPDDTTNPGKKMGMQNKVDASAGNVNLPRNIIEDPVNAYQANVTNSGALKVDGSGSTQPISGTVGISGTIPVSGNFYPVTQPISSTQLPIMLDGTGYLKVHEQGTSSVNVTNAFLPVTGTFWQTTQPISGSVSVSNFPSSQAVTGSFYQATQPVSLVSVPTHGVTGTFWQTTQPVSIASMPSTPVTGSVIATQATGSNLHVVVDSAPSTAVTGSVSVTNASIPVTGSFYQATQPVSLAAMPTTPVTGTFWQSTQPVSGTVTANQGAAPWTMTGTGTTSSPAAGILTVQGNASGVPIPITGSISATNPSVSTTGSTVPASATLNGMSQGGNLVALTGTSGSLNVNMTNASVPVTGTFYQATQPISSTQLPTALDGTGYLKTHEQGTANVNITNSSVAVTGTFFPATQPISAVSLPLATGAAQDSTISTMSGKLPAALDGSGYLKTHEQGVATVSGTVTANINGTVPVSGTFYQTTQPISGTITATQGTGSNLHVAVDSAPTTAVTGTFYQATQPVSIASMPSTPVTGSVTATQATGSNLHVAVDSAPTTAVTGTFYQATQPISSTQLPTALDGTGYLKTHEQGTANVNITNSSVAVTGTFYQSTQPVSIASMPSTPVTGTFWQATQPVSGTVAISGTVPVSMPTTNPCESPGAAVVGISGATSGTAAVQLIALSGSTKIYVCAVTVTGVSGTSPTFSLKYGTGTACATGGVTVWGPITTTALTFYQLPSNPIVTPAGQELCYVDGGTTPIQNYTITYVQQ